MADASLGGQLNGVRKLRGMSLKAVAGPAEISAAYLQKLERDQVKQPSPHILYALADVLTVPYSDLMQAAGYVVPTAGDERATAPTVLAKALGTEAITDDEAHVLARYLRWYRNEQGTD